MSGGKKVICWMPHIKKKSLNLSAGQKCRTLALGSGIRPWLAGLGLSEVAALNRSCSHATVSSPHYFNIPRVTQQSEGAVT